MAATTKRTTKRTPSRKPISEEEKQVKLEAYHTLKQVGAEIPADLQREVKKWVKDQQVREDRKAETEAESRARFIAEANINGPWYVRNMQQIQFNLRLERQQNERRLELKPRGQAGDMHPLKDEDLNDTGLQRNVHMRLVEIIPAGEAALVIEKQTHNLNPREYTPLAVLEGETGKPIKPENVKVMAEYNSQGVVVGTLTEDEKGNRNVSRFIPTGDKNAVTVEAPQGAQAPDRLRVSVAPVQRT
jgi:hypothetical protein